MRPAAAKVIRQVSDETHAGRAAFEALGGTGLRVQLEHDALRAAWQLLLNEGAAQEKILMETSICILQNMDEA